MCYLYRKTRHMFCPFCWGEIGGSSSIEEPQKNFGAPVPQHAPSRFVSCCIDVVSESENASGALLREGGPATDQSRPDAHIDAR